MAQPSKIPELKYDKYPFTRILGWSSSRYELFDKCKRQYFYNYYAKFAKDVPSYKIQKLKALTSVALEVGNVVHDIMEAFLKRLQKDDSNIDESRFFDFAKTKADDYFSRKTFMEVYYGRTDAVDMEYAYNRINTCLRNFIESPAYNWMFMKAIGNKENWLIEPEGYGETRLNGMKAYCKMDFLFPVDDTVYILDWKTGKRDEHKHGNQIIGYAAAASNNFDIPWNVIFPKIIYLFPEFSEFELRLNENVFQDFFQNVADQSVEMLSYCTDRENNIPRPREEFPMTPSESICKYCNYQELCFPESAKKSTSEF